MKKIITLLLIALSKNVFGFTEIEFVNYYYKPIKIEISSINSNSKKENDIFKETLVQEHRVYLTQNDYIMIEKSKIHFKIDHAICSKVDILGYHQVQHGRGIAIYLNDEFKGKICANKKSVVDYKYNAKLTFNKDSDNNPYVQFINNGWWNSEEIFPISFTFLLDK